MKCRIDPRFDCREIMKGGKGFWVYIGNCSKCDIFYRSGQIMFNKKENGEIEMKKPIWVKQRSDAIEEQRRKDLEEAGFKQYLTLSVGETKVEIDLSQEPQEREGKFGKQWCYAVKVDGHDYTLTASVVLDRQIIAALMKDINPMTIVRSGTGLNTRYSIKELS